MNTDHQSGPDKRHGTRLDGWKEVASYLHRAERTVKRWEQQWSLPVHRVPGGQHGRVYANTIELDEWLRSRSAQELEELEQVPEGQKNGIESLRSATLSEVAAPEAAPLTGAHDQVRSTAEGWLLRLLSLIAVGLAVYVLIEFGQDSATQKPLPSHGVGSNSGKPASAIVSESERRIAHELCLKGRYEWNYRTPDSLNRALDDFTQAIVHDHGSVQAYVGLADTYILLREYSTMPETEAYARALVAAQKAVALDDSSSEAHRALAFTLTNNNWDFVHGEKEYRRAIDLNPIDPVARRWFANSFAMQPYLHEALEQMDKAQELDPTSHATLADKGLLLYKAGRKQEGIELIKQVERTEPEFRSPHFYLMSISLVEHDYPTFLFEGEKTAQAENDPVLRHVMAVASAGYRRAGEKGLLQDLYTIQKKYYREGKLSEMLIAKTCIAMGRRQEALSIIEEEFLRHSPAFLWCLSDPDLLTLRYEPKFQQLLRSINFPSLPKNTFPRPPMDNRPPPMRAQTTSPS